MKENIKEDIKRISNLIGYIENADYVDASQCFDAEDIQAIDHILSDYKRILKENEKLKALDSSNSKMIANMSKRHFQDREKIRNSIPIQKVKDKIEELKKKVEELTDDKGYWGGSDLLEQIKVLQELIESEERK